MRGRQKTNRRPSEKVGPIWFKAIERHIVADPSTGALPAPPELPYYELYPEGPKSSTGLRNNVPTPNSNWHGRTMTTH